MTQNMVAYCRINAADVPQAVIEKVVGEDVKRRIQQEAEEKLHAEREAAGLMRWKLAQYRKEREEGVRSRLADQRRGVFAPAADAWAMAYACMVEWPRAVLRAVLDAGERWGLWIRE